MFSSQVAQLNEARSGASAALGMLSQCLEFLTTFRDSQGQRLDQVGTIEGQPFSIKETVVNAERVLRSFNSLALDKNKAVPSAVWQSATAAVRELSEASSGLLGVVATVNSEGRPLSASTGATISVRETGEAVANLNEVAGRLVRHADSLSQAVATLFMAVRASELARNNQEGAVVADDAKASASALTEAEAASRAAREAAGKVEALLDSLTATDAAASAARAAAHATLATQQAEVGSLLSDVKALSSSAREEAVAITTRLEDVTALKSQMDAATAALSNANGALATTKKEVVDTQQKADALLAQFGGQRNEIAAMLSNASDMLSASTVAGLATAFDRERTSLDRSLLWAQRWFGVGIALLILATLPLLFYVTNVRLQAGAKNIWSAFGVGEENYQVSLTGAIARGFVILGPFWLTLFSARRYRSLFELRQQYSHKYNMAFSVEGFKKQAPSYAEVIAAWVFSIVASSPVQQKPGAPMDEAPSTSFRDFIDTVTRQFRTISGIKDLS